MTAAEAGSPGRKLLAGSDYRLESVPCAICGSMRYEIALKGAKELYNGLDARFDVVRCGDCGHFFTNPRPTPETIGCFYPDSANYYQPKPERSGAKGEARSVWRRSAMASHFGYDFKELPEPFGFLAVICLRRRLLLSHLPRFVPDGRLLDIGCAWGGYLARMRQLGWRVYGVELNAAAAAYARDSLGLAEVRAGSFADCNYPDGYFAVVHMSMVLEHLHAPGEGLAKVARMLQPGGQLILSVPDFSGIEARLFRDKAYTLQVPQHLHHFTPASITRLLRQSGFRVERIVHQQTKADFIKSAGYLDDGPLRRLLTGGAVRKVFLGPMLALLSRLGCTSRMSVFAVRELPSGGGR